MGLTIERFSAIVDAAARRVEAGTSRVKRDADGRVVITQPEDSKEPTPLDRVLEQQGQYVLAGE